MKNLTKLIYFGAGFVVFYIDTVTPLGFTPWFLYIFLLFTYILYSNKQKIVAIASFYAILIITGYFLSPPLIANEGIPLVNRLIGIIMVAFLAVLGLKEEAAKKISSEILERIKDLFIAVDEKLNITFLNKSAMEFVGTQEDVVGRDVLEVIPNHDNVVLKKRMQEALYTRTPLHFELDLSNSDKYLDVSIYTSSKGLTVIAKDITERILAEKRLVKLLEEKETMMKEMHHRTKNNFQLVLSLLNLQINSVKDELAIKILNETRARLTSITLLYDKLFRTGDFYTVDMQMFISDIIKNMEMAANFGIIRMNHDLNIEPAKIGIECAIPLGLIMNELYTNSLKYAYNGSRTGNIKLEMVFLDNNTLYVKYNDNGKGLPENFNLGDAGGFGSSIISAFVEQLTGEIAFRNNNGAEFEMKLNVSRYQALQVI
jgi:PAS domain S-box-containing protein